MEWIVYVVLRTSMGIISVRSSAEAPWQLIEATRAEGETSPAETARNALLAQTRIEARSTQFRELTVACSHPFKRKRRRGKRIYKSMVFDVVLSDRETLLQLTTPKTDELELGEIPYADIEGFREDYNRNHIEILHSCGLLRPPERFLLT